MSIMVYDIKIIIHEVCIHDVCIHKVCLHNVCIHGRFLRLHLLCLFQIYSE